MHRRFVLVALIVIVSSWNAALLAAPTGDAPRLAALTYAAGSIICHQQPERSFHRQGAQYPVCARCLGLYVGALAGVFAWGAFAGFRRVPQPRATRVLATDHVRRVLVISALPTLFSVALAWSGLADASNVARAVLALPLGAAVAATITAVAAGDLR